MNRIQKLKLLIQILTIQLRIILLKQKLTIPSLDSPKFIIIHHEAGNSGFHGVNEWHRQKWGFKSSLGYYIGYQLYLDKDKKWHRGRSDFEEGAHCPGHNKDSVGICIMGNYQREIPRYDLMKLLEAKIDELRLKYGIPKENVLGDKEGRIPSRPTECPCRLMPFIENYRN